MVKNISVDDFANEVVNAMKQYTTDVEEAISDEVKRVGDLGAEDLRDVMLPSGIDSTLGTPAEHSQRRTWEMYAQSWNNKFEEKVNYSSSTIHNKRHYRLTHLLEYGHVTRNGTYTRSFPHIQKVSDKRQKELLENTKQIIKKGGKL